MLRRTAPLVLLGLSVLAGCSAAGDDASTTGGVGGGGGATVDAADGASDDGEAGAAGQAGSDGGGEADATGDAADAADAQGDGKAPLCAPDQDGDEIPDDIEGKATNVDTDGDGTPDWQDTDSDGDSIPDLIEGDTKDVGCNVPLNSDGVDQPDYRDLDSDDNGLPDLQEVYPDGTPYDPQHAGPNPADTDGDKRPDYADPDNDGDALPDTVELVNGQPVDTDHDGLPDLDDPDSDNDTILDGEDGTSDFDNDGLPNFRDPDSDDDGIPDSCEAGPNHQLSQAPVDTDLDGKYDFADLDSDGDGLLDSEEDVNHNCVVDLGETDRVVADTDHDGYDDLVEVTLGSDPNDPFSTPPQLGKFFFRMPYQDKAVPQVLSVPVRTDLQKADVAFVIDTTGTMGPELTALQAGLNAMATGLKNAIPDVAIGIAGHDDFPVDPYGVAGLDLPFWIPPNGLVSTNLGDTNTAVSKLTLHNGEDGPESQVTALWRALTNKPYQYPGQLATPDPIPNGTFGSLAFRPDALTVLVNATDAPYHNGRRVLSAATLHDPYSFNAKLKDTFPYGNPTVDDLVAEMTSKGARFIGLAINDGVGETLNPRSGDPYEDMAYIADQTNSNVPKSAFGIDACATGLGGLPLPIADGPNASCRLVFDVMKNGQGLTDRVVDGVKALLRSLTLDVRVVADDPNAYNNPAPYHPNDVVPLDAVDTFIDHIEVSTSGGTDPTDPNVPCVTLNPADLVDAWQGPKGLVNVPDTYWDTVKKVVPPMKLCFDIVPSDNYSVPQLDVVQVYHAILQVKAKNGLNPIELNFGPPRDVLFVVPPAPQ